MKKIISTTIVAAFLVILIPVSIWLFTFYDSPLSQSGEDWAYFGGYMGGVITPIIAFCSFIGLLTMIYYQWKQIHKESKWKNNEIYCAHAVNFMKRAFEVISNNGKATIPIKSRQDWLTCARFLLTAKNFSRKIDENSIKEKFWDEEEYWRMRFYNLFKPTDLNAFSTDSQYFSNPSETTDDCIDKRSIAVIYRFIDWPEDRPDPIDNVEKFTEQEIKKMHFGMYGIKEYIKKNRGTHNE